MQRSFSSAILSPQLQSLIGRWVTFHRVLWALTLGIFFISWNRGLALLYGLFSMLSALLLISYILPKWQLRHIRVSRQPMDHFTAGKPGSITYCLEANRPRYHVELLEALEFADKTDQKVFFSKIHGKMSRKLQFHCLKRGSYQLGECRLASAYPFGIMNFTKKIRSEPMEVLVFPRLFPLARIPVPLMAHAASWGDVPISQKGGRDEFTSVREYSRGDELNRIHWPVSARHQNLVVKLYETTDRPALLVVLDCNPKFNMGEAHRSTFEYAVSIAASMIRFASRQGIQCFLAAQCDHLIELTIQAYSTDLFPLYESLARLDCNSRQPYRRLVEQAHRRFPKANLVTTFRLASDPAQIRLSPHVTQIDLEMDHESFSPCAQPEQTACRKPRQEGNRLIYPIHAGQQLENLFL